MFFGIAIDDIRADSTMFKIIVNQMFLACRHEAPHNKRTLIVLDEFPQLDWKELKEALVVMRSRNVKLWLQIQTLDQCLQQFKTVQDFLGMCDVQAFAINDPYSQQIISQLLGEYREDYLEGDDGKLRSMDKTYLMRTPGEVAEDLKNGSGIQYVFPVDGAPMRLKLSMFSKWFKDNTGFKQRPKE